MDLATSLISPQQLEDLVQHSLREFYKRRLERIRTLDLREALRRKNPYLFRAVGIERAADLVESVLQARGSSSDETIFGDAFFEPIVLECVKQVGGRTSVGRGTDIVIETDSTRKPKP